MTRVLLAGPDSGDLERVSAKLDAEGMAVARAGDAVATLEALDADPADCVVAAPRVGRVEGRQLLRQLRDRGHAVPAVLLYDGPPPSSSLADAVAPAGEPEAVVGCIEEVVADHHVTTERRRRRRQRAAVERAREALAGADSREAVEEAVCRELAASEAYRSVWVGRYNDSAGTVVPAAAAGVELGHLSAVPEEDADRATAGALGGEPTVVPDDERVTVGIPIGGEPLGVVYLHADRPDGVPEGELSGLSSLGADAADRIVDLDDGGQPEVGDPFTVLGDSLAHELNNQLDIATMHLDLARDREDSDTHFDYVETALERMTALAADTRALATGDIDEAEVDLRAVAADAWETVDTAGASLETEEGTVVADRDLLALLFENLFRNAVEHGSTSPRPGDEDAVEHGSTGGRPAADDAVAQGAVEGRNDADSAGVPGEIGLTVRVEPLDGGGFAVSDDGQGIPEDERDQVFEWGHSAGDGMGVGLGIVALVARRHGWSVSLTESDGGGARFEFA